MVSFTTLVLSAVAAVALSAQAALLKDTSKSSADLEQRDNRYKLKCGNAPSVVAGDFLHPSDVPGPAYDHRLVTPPPLSGSNEPFMDYVWCTPNTSTYTFFGVGTVSKPPWQWYDTRGALAQAVTNLTNYLARNSDGPLAGGQWSFAPQTTRMEVYVQDSKGKMTYGVLLSALTGLSQVAEAYIREKKTMVFQVNDGGWGEMGIGYAGFVWEGDRGGCVYDLVEGADMSCEDVKRGLVIK